jgi:cytochrome o ubiquinol oxidase subunit 1
VARCHQHNPTGIFSAFFAVVLGFALIWHIWWMAVLGLIGALGVLLMQAWRTDTEVLIPAEEIARYEREHALRSNGQVLRSKVA